MSLRQIFAFIALTLTVISCQNQTSSQENESPSSVISDKDIDQKNIDEILIKTNEIWDSLSEQLKNEKFNEIQKDSLRRLITKNKEQQETIFQNFIRQNPNSIVSIETLNGFKFSWGKDLTEKLFKSLNTEIQSSDKGELVKEYIKYYRNPEISDKHSDFTLPNTKGDSVRLAKKLNDYTLLEFWASWCSGCRKEHPKLIQVYEKYKDRKFTVIGISSDSSEEDWLNAIEKDKLPWINLRDSNGRESIVQYKYGIHFIPTNFLIGPNKEILAKDIKPKELDNLLEIELGETALNNGSAHISGIPLKSDILETK